MNTLPLKQQVAETAAIDQLLQDSYLLIVELQQRETELDIQGLRRRCVTQIEHVRGELERAGMSQANIDHISHAHCALLDETLLGVTKGDDHAVWASEPLQARFFSRHQAGDFLYDELHELLRQPMADAQVLTVYQRVLTLGFRGRYRDVEAPQRAQLLVDLNKRVLPLHVALGMSTHTGSSMGSGLARIAGSPLAQCTVAILVLAAGWWGLARLLDGQVATLLAGVS